MIMIKMMMIIIIWGTYLVVPPRAGVAVPDDDDVQSIVSVNCQSISQFMRPIIM